MEQSNLLELARQGEPNAIAALMNAVLSPKGITARAGVEDDCLCIFLESQKPLNQETLVAFIQKGLLELGNDSIRSVRAQGRRVGDETFAWTREFSLRSSEPTSRVATLTPPLEDELPEEPIEFEEDEIEEEESLSFRSWVKRRWKVYALPVVLVVIGGFVAGGTTAIWSTSKNQAANSSLEAVMKPQNNSPEAKQKEAEAYLKAMTTAQENFYKQNNRFASSLEELERSTNVISQSYSYAYRLKVGTDAVMMAVPREADLQSYISVVNLTSSGTTSIVCQSLKPSMQPPEKPKAPKGSKALSCGARSRKLP